MKKIVYYSLLLGMFSSCQSWDQELTLINKSDKQIYYWVTCDSSYANIEIHDENQLKPNESIQPYLLFGPEGKGPKKNKWENAINWSDDSALHIFCFYLDSINYIGGNNNRITMPIKRYDLKAATLDSLHWSVTYY